MEETPTGMRFSHLYLRRGEPTADSRRMRYRLARLAHSFANRFESLAEVLQRELGVRVPHFAYTSGANWESFLKDAELRDVLDFVTLATTNVRGHGQSDYGWVKEVRRIFEEEQVGYRVDDLGGVHYSIDDEFEAGRRLTIAALEGGRYKASAANFEAAQKALSQVPPRGKDAIRLVFSAAEGLFRQMFPKAPRLGGAEISAHLVPVLNGRYSGDPTAAGAASKLVRSFREWVDAAHFYRHEPGHPEPTEPPIDVTIMMVSGGAAWLRWLAEIDRSTAPSNESVAQTAPAR